MDGEVFHSLVAFEALGTEHVREIRKNSETVHMQIPSITYLSFYCFSVVILWLKIHFLPSESFVASMSNATYVWQKATNAS